MVSHCSNPTKMYMSERRRLEPLNTSELSKEGVSTPLIARAGDATQLCTPGNVHSTSSNAISSKPRHFTCNVCGKVRVFCKTGVKLLE